MAVKVMVAPAIARGELAKPAATRAAATKAVAKPKRRRSSVYDADGNEVFITLMCLKCHKMRPLSQFGLRKMADGAIRNQPWCRTCRSAPSADEPAARKGRRAEPVAPEDSAISGESPSTEASPATTAARGGSMAAEVAAALAAGRR
jgi:hypothetical protein